MPGLFCRYGKVKGCVSVHGLASARDFWSRSLKQERVRKVRSECPGGGLSLQQKRVCMVQSECTGGGLFPPCRNGNKHTKRQKVLQVELWAGGAVLSYAWKYLH
jgi:hypothetical protein